MRKYKFIVAVLTVFCIAVGLPLVAFAADAKPLIINSQTIEEISVIGTADAITVSDNSYSIKSVDASETGCNSTKYN